jgi:hypothetical protein
MRHTMITACGVLMLTFQIDIAHTSQAESLVHRQTGVIRVWKIGSPHSGALPKTAIAGMLQREAEKLNHTIEIEAFTAAGFATRFSEALDKHNEPEVIAFDNFGVLVGITTDLGRFDGILADERVPSSLVMVRESLEGLQSAGWVMLVRTARNYEAAKALAMRWPTCKSAGRAVVTGLTPEELQSAQEAAIAAARAYLTCDAPLLASLSDQARLGGQCFLPTARRQVDAVELCSMSGNRNLIFASLISSFEAERRALQTYGGDGSWLPPANLGHQSLLAILRRSNDGWQLLAISDDSLSVDAFTAPHFERLTARLENGLENQDAAAPELISKDGIYPVPAPGKRFGDFVWRPSTSADIVGQVAEFNGVFIDRELTRLIPLSADQGQLSTGMLMGDRKSPFRWRVWAITKNGGVSFSEKRSFRR